jgi:hypothetical protein
MNDQVREYITRIFLVDREGISPHMGGMSGYGERFVRQRNYYSSLSPEEKQIYEDAVVELCLSNNFNQANFGLYICSELADLFPEDWKKRVVDLVNTLVIDGLPLTYPNTISDPVLYLIRYFNMQLLIPFQRQYLHQILEAYISGRTKELDMTLFGDIFINLIHQSQGEFWEEFRLFYENHKLVNRLKDKLNVIAHLYVFYGTQVRGLEWIKKLALEYSKLTSPVVRTIGIKVILKFTEYLASIGQESRNIIIHKSEQNVDYSQLIEWIRKLAH